MNREITETQRDWLARELDAWREAGLVGDDQAKAILSLYGTEAEAAARRQSRAVSILLFLAALLAGLGVLLLVAYNWSDLPAAAKVVLVLAAVTAAHSIGLGLRFRKGMRTASEVAFFLGCLLYGAGIGLIGQTFHVNANDAGAFWWWAVGVLPFALALDSLAFHVLYVGLAATWAGYQVIGFGDLGAWLFLGRWRAVPDGAYGLLVLAAPGFAWAYRRQDVKALSLYVPLLAWWVILQPIAWRLGDNPSYLIGSVGALLLLVAELHRSGSPMSIPYRFWGTGLVGGVLVPLSFLGFQEVAWRAGIGEALGLVAGPLLMAAAAAAMLWGTVAWRRRGDAGEGTPRPIVEESLAIAGPAAVPLALLGLFAGMALWRLFTMGEAILPTVAANLAMLALAFWLMRVGLRDDRGRPFSAGVAYFLLWAMLRYFDLFGDFGGMPGAALMFFLCGAALFGVALYWRRRKEVRLA